MADDKRENKLYHAKIAEQLERYDEMKDAMKNLVEIASNSESNKELNEEERNLLSVAYKNIISYRRASCRALVGIKNKEDSKPDSESHKEKIDIIKQYETKVQDEMKSICTEIFDLLDSHLIPKATEAEVKVFYLKMKGDYYRYLAEILDGPKKAEVTNNAKDVYCKATEECETLAPTHPIRLGLALNFSVFFYEILNQKKAACKLAKEAFDNAISDLDTVTEDRYKDATLIMQLLRDNLTLWTSDDETADDAEDGAEPVLNEDGKEESKD